MLINICSSTCFPWDIMGLQTYQGRSDSKWLDGISTLMGQDARCIDSCFFHKIYSNTEGWFIQDLTINLLTLKKKILYYCSSLVKNNLKNSQKTRGHWVVSPDYITISESSITPAACTSIIRCCCCSYCCCCCYAAAVLDGVSCCGQVKRLQNFMATLQL